MKNYSSIRKTPITRILFLFIIGILIAKYTNLYLSTNANLIFIITSILLIALLIIGLYKSLSKYFDYFLTPTIISIAICLTLFNAKVPTNFENEHIWQGIIYEKPLLKNNSILLPVKISPNQFETYRILKAQKVLLYIPKDNNIIGSVTIGDNILFKAQLKRISNYGNPNEFDYAEYMFNKGITFQSYAPIAQIKFSKADSYPVKRFLSLVQEKALKQFKNSIKNKEAFAIVSALTLGYKHYLSDNLKQSFVNSGAIHVLAVSGLHVGIIYMFLNFILGVFTNKLKHRILKTAIIITFIWSYAILSGLSPSITRAAIMFSLIAIGKTLSRDISFFNILGSAALILLIANPFSLFNVGFQLSFLAVGGIVYFQPLLYNIYHFKYVITDKIYQLFTVSIAAQLVTAPLTLYYFHQFPSYFWLTNILLIPLISIALITSIILLITSWIPYFHEILGFIVELVLNTTNNWVKLIENLPYSVIENVQFSISSLLIAFALIALTTAFLRWKKPVYIYSILSVLIIGGMINLLNKFTYNHQNKIVFYNFPKQDNIGIYSNNKNYLLYTAEISNHRKTINSYFKPHWLKTHKSEKVKTILLETLSEDPKNYNNGNYMLNKIKLSNKEDIIIFNSSIQNLSSKINSKYLFVCNKSWPPDANILSAIIILSNTTPNYIKLAWKEYARKNNLKAIDLGKTGALTIKY